ncbi:hypothetical protein EJ110_NYTH19156 [Nymphaea thermarum]|nr:hypothetical protein EJ110_NYTH19156 [Nymphaea thermarum]
MEGFDDDGPSSQENPREFSDAGFSGNARFDASQYAFFGKNVAEEVELGGLDDADDPLVGFDDEEYRFSSIGEREEGCSQAQFELSCSGSEFANPKLELIMSLTRGRTYLLFDDSCGCGCSEASSLQRFNLSDV